MFGFRTPRHEREKIMAAKPVTIEDLNEQIARRQRVLLGKITTREHHIARLRAEQDQLRAELAETPTILGRAWATR